MPVTSANLPVSTADAATSCDWDTVMRHFPAPTADASTNCSEDDVMEPPSMVMVNVCGRISPDQLLDDLEPMSRDRSKTWPRRRPQLDIRAEATTLIHELFLGTEENNLYNNELLDVHDSGLQSVSSVTCSEMGSPEAQSVDGYSLEESSPTSRTVPVVSSSLDTSDSDPSPVSPTTKKPTTRRNAWGNVSYADLITQAIVSSPDKRLTLFQVYEWMVQNVAYFYDKGDSNSSAGWKNSIRHNLSLHTRFMRIQNESAGKSSWWTINPEVQPGRKPRGSAQMHETSAKPPPVVLKKHILKKHKLTARNEKSELIAIYVGEMREEQRNQTMRCTSKSVVGSQASAKSVVNQELQSSEDDFWLGAFDGYDAFRPRAQSDLSMLLVPGKSARASSLMGYGHRGLSMFDYFEDYEVPNELLDCTEEMRLSDL